MRARVELNWRTRFLFLLVFVAAGVIAYQRVQARMAEERAAAQEESTPGEGTSGQGDVVEVEIVAE